METVAGIEEWNLDKARQNYDSLSQDARRMIAHLDDEVNMGHLDNVRAFLTEVRMSTEETCWDKLHCSPLLIQDR